MKEIPILLAGYGWFRGIPEGGVNNAEAVARAMDGERIRAHAPDGREVSGRVHGLSVPVSWAEAFPCVEKEALRLRPAVGGGNGDGGVFAHVGLLRCFRVTHLL